MQIDHTKTIIELRNVSFSYGGEKVLTNVNLSVHKGDYLGVVGPNGGGKTTLLKIMLGLLKPKEGKVILFGAELSTFKEWSRIGYVPQKAVNFDAHFPITVWEVASMGRFGKRGLFRHLDQYDERMVEEALKKVEMYAHKDTIMGNLSGGQQQRVFIARALSCESEIIVLDEPTTGVDQKTQQQFYKLLKKLNTKFGITLVLVSHYSNIIARETTEIACVNKTLYYETNPQELLKTPFHKH